jgi:hypothetical protein
MGKYTHVASLTLSKYDGFWLSEIFHVTLVVTSGSFRQDPAVQTIQAFKPMRYCLPILNFSMARQAKVCRIFLSIALFIGVPENGLIIETCQKLFSYYDS